MACGATHELSGRPSGTTLKPGSRPELPICRRGKPDLSVAPPGHSFRRGDVDYVLFSFGALARANLFRARPKGEHFDPKIAPRGCSMTGR
jgi:hypothetical protein